MREEHGVGAIRAAVVALNEGDIDGYLSLFEPACPRFIAGFDEPLSLSDIRDSLLQFHAAFEDLFLVEDLLFGDDRYVCARWRLQGRQVADYLGVVSRGATIDLPTCEIYEFGEDRVVASWAHGDPGMLFRQLGAGLEGETA